MRQLLLLVLGGVLLAGCTSEPTASFAPETSDPMSPESVSDAYSPGPYEFTTTILDGRYQHVRLDAFLDGTIRWWNVDDEVHSVVSDDGTFAGSGPIAPGSEFAYTFLTPGDYAFHCRYHPDMTGVVVVR